MLPKYAAVNGSLGPEIRCWTAWIVSNNKTEVGVRRQERGWLTILDGTHQDAPSCQKQNTPHRPSVMRPFSLALASFRSDMGKAICTLQRAEPWARMIAEEGPMPI